MDIGRSKQEASDEDSRAIKESFVLYGEIPEIGREIDHSPDHIQPQQSNHIFLRRSHIKGVQTGLSIQKVPGTHKKERHRDSRVVFLKHEKKVLNRLTAAVQSWEVNHNHHDRADKFCKVYTVIVLSVPIIRDLPVHVNSSFV